MFPHLLDNEEVVSSGRVLACQKVPIFCSCKMPEVEDEVYFECTNKDCGKWFHPDCQGLGPLTKAQMKKRKNLRCVQCQTKSKRKRCK